MASLSLFRISIWVNAHSSWRRLTGTDTLREHATSPRRFKKVFSYRDDQGKGQPRNMLHTPSRLMLIKLTNDEIRRRFVMETKMILQIKTISSVNSSRGVSVAIPGDSTRNRKVDAFSHDDQPYQCNENQKPK